MSARDKKLLLDKLADEGPMSASALAGFIQLELEKTKGELEELQAKDLLTVVRRESTDYYGLSNEGKRLVLAGKRYMCF